jgi:hypothetical protein
MREHALRAISSANGSLSALAIRIGAVALLMACGDPADHDLGNTAPSKEAAPPGDDVTSSGVSGGDVSGREAGSAGEAASGAEASSDAALPECAKELQACGGLLAGEWTVVGTCDTKSSGPVALGRWGSSVAELDLSTCPDAAALTTEWSGKLSFQDGVLFDERQRSDRLALNITPDCLDAAQGEPVASDTPDDVCPALGDGSIPCTSVDGSCRCSASRDELMGTSGAYGVLGLSVAFASAEGPTRRVEYCVQGSALHWTDAATGQHVVLRRTGAAPAPAADPGTIPR